MNLNFGVWHPSFIGLVPTSFEMQCTLHFRYMRVQALKIEGFQRVELWAARNTTKKTQNMGGTVIFLSRDWQNC